MSDVGFLDDLGGGDIWIPVVDNDQATAVFFG